MRIYLAGPISGMSYDAVISRIKDLSKRLERYGYKVIHPILGKDYLRTEIKFKSKGYEQPVSKNHAIFERDKWMITKRADILLADLSNSEWVSIGTCF